ncbi:MAG: tetratricopeptide repeat protein [Alphaproteobacteria bacterium]
MTPIAICLIISGIITLLITIPIMQKRPYICYFLMVSIPLITLATALYFFPIEQAPPPQNETERAETHIKNGDFINAINILENSIKKNEGSEENIIQLGRAYFAKGLLHAENNEKEKALINLRKAQTIFPEDSYYLTDLQGFIDKIEAMDMDTQETEK